VAATLNNLGELYGNTGRSSEAEKALTEALAIKRDLAVRDPGAYRPTLPIRHDLAAREPDAYRPDLANTLFGLGLLYFSMQREADARTLLEEALTTYRDPAPANPAAYAGRVESLTTLLAEHGTSSSPAEP
jgi:tetratricopeptide (TPR) repeat protein